MWNYQKSLEYPINIKKPDARAAMVIISQYGGPDGELAASLRYLSQRYAMPNRHVAGLLNDIGTEELVPISYHRKTLPGAIRGGNFSCIRVVL